MHEDTSAQQARIDAICVEFENAWQRGEEPCIESALAELSVPDRSIALPQLLLIELEYLQKAQVVPDVDDYLLRFPQDATLVRLAMRVFEDELPPIDPAQVIAESIGSEVGRYKLLEPIGEGGMGVVFMAEQQRPVRRRVALKIIKPGMDSKHVIARFEAERQALAIMDHANIARVLDAGTTETGRPYFVMELVRGIPITEFCDLNKLKAQERLYLFLVVCHAVQHAHTKGIIHRDIKPTNVLVTLHDGVPVPKIIDFGVAKATGQRLTERTLFTSFGQMVGTPLYMSPEQAELSGLDVDTRSDIYSLGVLLYELLTGTTPFDRQRMQTAAYDEMRRIIREEEPEKPSTRVSTMGKASVVASSHRSTDPTKLRQQLRGELDWIVMKTLEKDRNRRYLTASDLAAEVTRYLNGEPVDAGPPSTTYRLRKFVTRYRSQVVVACGFLTVVLVSAVLAGFLYVQASQAHKKSVAAGADLIVERDRAQKARNRAEEEKSRANAQAEELEKRVYDLNIINAQTAADRDNVSESLALLNSCSPVRRDWEWHRLNHQLRHFIAAEYPCPPQDFMGVIPSADASKLATFGDNGLVRVVDASTGHELLDDRGELHLVRSVAFSPNADLLGVARWNNQPLTRSDIGTSMQSDFRVLHVDTGKLLWKLREPEGLVGAAQFSPDGRSIALWRGGSTQGHITLHEVTSGEEIWSVPTEQWPFEMRFSPDGRRMYFNFLSEFNLSQPSTLACWCVDTQEELWSIDRPVTSEMEISGDGQSLLTGGPDHTVQIWDTSSGQQIDEFANEVNDMPYSSRNAYGVVGTVNFSHDGKYFLSRCDRYITVWDWSTRKPRNTLLHPQSKNTRHTSFSANDQHLILADSRFEAGVIVRDIDSVGSELTLPGHTGGTRAVQYSPNGRELLSIGWDGTARTWDSATGQVTWMTRVPVDKRGAVAYSPTGDKMATAGAEGVKVWKTKTKTLLHHWPDANTASCLKFNVDGNMLVAAGYSLKVWNVSTGSQVWQHDAADEILDLKVIAGAGRLAMIDDLGNVDLAHIDRRESKRLHSETMSIPEKRADSSSECLAYDQNGDRIAVGRLDRIEFRDMQGNLQQTLHNEDTVLCLEFSGDGSRLFAGDASGVLSIWNTESCVKLLHLQTPQQGILGVSPSPDEKTVATAGSDGTVVLWETLRPSEDVIAKRRLVHEATQIVAAQYAESGTLEELRSLLKSDATISDQLLPVALEIANTYGGDFPMQEFSN
ncbi:MAG: protein kinase [Planctomycetales bacterium]|nr:protein kinase [Planctomycetales bacterium]